MLQVSEKIRESVNFVEELINMYMEIGVSPGVYAYGEKALERLKERFAAIDAIAEYNQAKVLNAMRKTSSTGIKTNRIRRIRQGASHK